MSGALETRVFYYCAPTPEAADGVRAHGFSNERADDSRMRLGVLLHDQLGYFAQVSGQPFEVTVVLRRRTFEAAVIEVSGVPTGKYLFGAGVLNAHATWRPIPREAVESPEARAAFERAEAAYQLLIKQRGDR